MKRTKKIGLVVGCLGVVALSAHAGLVGYWDFETIDSGVTPDRSGLGYDLQVMGAAALSNDAPAATIGSSSMYFNGTDAYLFEDANAATNLQISGSLTMSVWRKAATNGVPIQEVISAAHSDYRWRIAGVNTNNGNASEQVYIESQQAANVWSGANLVWNHFVMVWDEENQEGRLYKNGNLLQTKPLVATLTTSAPYFSIGAYFNEGYGLFFKGQMDDVAIFDQVLTVDQIKNLSTGARTPLTVLDPPPVLTKNLLVGWEDWNATNENQVATKITTPDLLATLTPSTDPLLGDAEGNWTVAGDLGSRDGDFGTIPGANTNGSCMLARGDGVYLDITITNVSTLAYQIEGLHFDGWIRFNAYYVPAVSILPGGGLTAGNLITSGWTALGATPPPDADYTDADIILVDSLADSILDVGESVTFRIASTGAGVFFDNVGITGSVDGADPGYDTWALRYNLQESQTGDDDKDGLINLYEYGLGGDPTNALDQGTAPTIEIAEVGGSNVLTYIYPQLSDPNAGLAYSVELTTDLVFGTWTNDGYTVTGTNITKGTLDFVTNVTSATEEQKFINLKIENR